MDIASAIGYCKQCNGALISVNNEPQCLRCKSKAQAKGERVVDTEDPGDDYFNRTKNGRSGVKSSVKSPIKVNPVKKVVSGNTVQDALEIMKSLPMPDDIKEFKQIKKIIGLMEKLVNPQE